MFGNVTALEGLHVTGEYRTQHDAHMLQTCGLVSSQGGVRRSGAMGSGVLGGVGSVLGRMVKHSGRGGQHSGKDVKRSDRNSHPANPGEFAGEQPHTHHPEP